MYKRLLASVFALGFSVLVFADKQVLINGSIAEKSDVTEITFKGDNLVLTYSDGSTFMLDMETVEINFSDATSTGGVLAGVFSLNTLVEDELVLSGLQIGEQIQIMGVDGKIYYSSFAEAENVRVSTASLAPSPYIIKVGKQIIKFIKK
ncbi:MAG: hypothetical protein MJZ33_12570 [Paludibacteraceae bacterium]|nr:hypothetical protein [Paludibacteraceae bacterium]